MAVGFLLLMFSKIKKKPFHINKYLLNLPFSSQSFCAILLNFVKFDDKARLKSKLNLSFKHAIYAQKPT